MNKPSNTSSKYYDWLLITKKRWKLTKGLSSSNRRKKKVIPTFNIEAEKKNDFLLIVYY